MYRDRGELEKARHYVDELADRYPRDARAPMLRRELRRKQEHPNRGDRVMERVR